MTNDYIYGTIARYGRFMIGLSAVAPSAPSYSCLSPNKYLCRDMDGRTRLAFHIPTTTVFCLQSTTLVNYQWLNRNI